MPALAVRFVNILRGSSAAIWVAAIVILLLGTIGFHRSAQDAGVSPPYDLSTLLFMAAQLFVLNSGAVEGPVSWELEIARWTAALWSASVVFKVLAHLFPELCLAVRVRGNHIIVCGLGDKGMAVLRGLRAQQRMVVAVERDASLPEVREARNVGALVVIGDAADHRTLKRARALHASHCAVLCGNDLTNLAVFQALTAVCGSSGIGPKTFVHLLNPAFARVAASAGRIGCARAGVFNAYAVAARRLLLEHPLDGDGIGFTDPRFVRLVIVGFGRMGQALAAWAARIGTFANEKPLSLALIDPEIGRLGAAFDVAWPNLSRCCNVEHIGLDVYHPTVRARLAEWASDPDCLLRMALCFEDDERNLSAAIDLPFAVREKATVYARCTRELPPGCAESVGGRLVPFSELEGLRRPDAVFLDDLDRLARQIHEQWRSTVERARAACEAAGKTPPEPAPAWEQVEEEVRWSNRQQADSFAVKLRAVGYRIVPVGSGVEGLSSLPDEVIEGLARWEHNRWMAEKLMAGWVFGPEKDAACRVHPDLVPYEQLPESVKDLDREPMRRMLLLLREAGLVATCSPGLEG